MTANKRVAFDIGGVIGPTLKERRLPGGGFSLEPGPKPGAIEVVRRCVAKHGAKNCFIISRVSKEAMVEAKWAWLRRWNFIDKTGFLRENIIIYCGLREHKAVIARQHGITLMVDDRPEVLLAMPPGIELVAFAQDEVRFFDEVLRSNLLSGRHITGATTWDALAFLLDLELLN